MLTKTNEEEEKMGFEFEEEEQTPNFWGKIRTS